MDPEPLNDVTAIIVNQRLSQQIAQILRNRYKNLELQNAYKNLYDRYSSSFQSQTQFLSAFSQLINSILFLQPLNIEAELQYVQRNKAFFVILQNITKIIALEKSFPQQTNFIASFFTQTFKNFSLLYNHFLCIQNKDSEKKMISQRQSPYAKYSLNFKNNNFVSENIEIRQKGQSDHEEKMFNAQISIAINFFSTLLINKNSFSIIQRLINNCYQGLYKCYGQSRFDDAIKYMILEKMFENFEKLELNCLKLTEKKLNYGNQIEHKRFSLLILEKVSRIYSQTKFFVRNSIEQKAWYKLLFKVIHFLNRVNKSNIQFAQKHKRLIMYHLNQKQRLKFADFQKYILFGTCLLGLMQIQIKQSECKQFLQLIQIYIKSNNDNFLIKSSIFIQLYESVVLLLSSMKIRCIKFNYQPLLQTMIEEMFKALNFDKNTIFVAHIKIKIYQAIQKMYKIIDDKAFYEKIQKIPREKQLNFNPSQLLIASLYSLHCQSDIHLNQYQLKEEKLFTKYINQKGNFGHYQLNYMKRLKVQVEKFKARLKNNYKDYLLKLNVETIQQIFQCPQKLEEFYSGIIIQAYALNVLLSKTPKLFFIFNEENSTNIFLYFYYPIQYFSNLKIIQQKKWNVNKIFDINWLNQNVSNYIVQILKLLIINASDSWRQDCDAPFFQKLNMQILIDSFTKEFNQCNLEANIPFEKYLMALAQPVSNLLCFLIDNFYINIKFQKVVSLTNFLEKLISVTQIWNKQKRQLPFKQSLYSSLCSLINHMIQIHPLESFFDDQGNVIQKLNEIKQIVKHLFKTVIKILLRNNKNEDENENDNICNKPQKYVCFLELFNNILVNYGPKLVIFKAREKILNKINPLFQIFQKLIQDNNEGIRKIGFQNYNEIQKNQNFQFLIISSKLYQQKNVQTILNKNQRLLSNGREKWVKVISILKYLVLSENYYAKDQATEIIYGFLKRFGNSLNSEQHLQGQIALLQCIIQRLQNYHKNQNLSLYDYNRARDQVSSLIKIVNQIISINFKRNQNFEVSQNKQNKYSTSLSFINLHKSKLEINQLTIDQFIKVLQTIKSVCDNILTISFACVPNNQYDRKNNEKDFQKFNQELNLFRRNLADINIPWENKMIKYSNTQKLNQKKKLFQATKQICNLMINTSRLRIHSKWMGHLNGKNIEKRFMTFIKEQKARTQIATSSYKIKKNTRCVDGWKNSNVVIERQNLLKKKNLIEKEYGLSAQYKKLIQIYDIIMERTFGMNDLPSKVNPSVQIRRCYNRML